jgi:hypothetical protein
MKQRKKRKPKPPVKPKKPLPKAASTRLKLITQWCIGTIIGVLVLSVIGNHISAVIPNPFSYLYNLVRPTNTQQKRIVWYTAGIQNKLNHELSITTWKDGNAVWYGETLKSGEIKLYSETGPIYIQIQGDFIAQLGEKPRLTHTYEGAECYELETKTFDHQPTDEEIKQAPVNKVEEVIGGPNPKVIKFVDGTKVTFDMFGPRNLKLRALLPEEYEGQMVYPFQLNRERNNEK